MLPILELMPLAQIFRPKPGGFRGWLIDFLIDPSRQSHPAAAKTAEDVFYWTLLCVFVGALLAFLAKWLSERRAIAQGVDRIAYGPRRSLVVLICGWLLFIAVYLLVNWMMINRFWVMMGAGNVIKITVIGLVLFTLLYLLFLLPAYRRHMPWNKVK